MIQQTIFLLTILLLIGCSKKQKELNPETKQLTEAVYASGNLVPENEYKVISSTRATFYRPSYKKEVK
jgi:hypothetical protein